MKEPLVVAWSSGKDSALALQEILETECYDITLLTTVTEGYERISMHGVRELSRRFIEMGFQAVVTWVDTRALPPSFTGRLYDLSFVADLPAQADPCGRRRSSP